MDKLRIPVGAILLALILVTTGVVVAPLCVYLFSGTASAGDVVIGVVRRDIERSLASNVISFSSNCLNVIHDLEHGTATGSYMDRFLANRSSRMNDPQYDQEVKLEVMHIAMRNNAAAGFLVNRDTIWGETVFCGGNNTLARFCDYPINETVQICDNGSGMIVGTGLDERVTLDVLVSIPTNPQASRNDVPATPKVRWKSPNWFVWHSNDGNKANVKVEAGLACQKALWLTKPPPKAPPYTQNYDFLLVGVLDIKPLVSMLRAVQATPNTIIAMIDYRGRTLATNRLDLGLNEAGDGPALISSIGSVPLQTISNATIARYSNWTNIPSAVEFAVKVEGEKYWAALRSIKDDYGFEIILCMGIPQSDLLRPLIQARNAAIKSVCITGACMVAIVALVSYLVTLPLKRLSSAMRKANQFDFSALRKVPHIHRWGFKEAAETETAFYTMVRKFANEIDEHKAFMAGQRRLSLGPIREIQPRGSSGTTGPSTGSPLSPLGYPPVSSPPDTGSPVGDTKGGTDDPSAALLALRP